ncbi:hypothetical protein BK126_22230 [Paenibacillus sp. FSL H7-0326]|uniref:DUF2264 domain-containing protein n=2 Tax=Paenibacillus sp. FSL H7-0326 TaxID=1921144 RepID=UPI00096D982E|nr:DUF2264 domain-containing protein [Paenibacillus sp. FSL H7-0326]OMC65423.1 hypothetical protein BK126_22230 [Paenibacillus sp. FSL H7-0326]
MSRQKTAISSNPLKSKADMVKAVNQLCDPLIPYFSDSGALLDIGDTYSQTSRRVAQMEGCLRPLWGLAPLYAGGGSWDGWEIYIRGLINGSDPGHADYWGDISSYDQKQVEIASIALLLILAPEHSWNRLDEVERIRLADWLNQTNARETVDTNWRFFRVLVNLALYKRGLKGDAKKMEEDLNRLDQFYISGGWYTDGDTDQIDYYVPFAFHYYSLIYAKQMENEDPIRSKLYKERASLFARDFIYWFGETGEAVAFGRSMTYRFAQSCFWGALAYAGVEAFPWGVVKGLLLRNLRWWFNQPIFSLEGILTIGYSYSNLNMSEGYNAPGSPYWAMKSFLPLALADDHPFWQSEELPLPHLEQKSVQREARMILTRENTGKHVIMFPAGQYAGFEPANNVAKYAKFAYSNIYGFSVSKGNYGLVQGAYDNSLALAEKDGLYRTRGKCDKFEISDSCVYAKWKPWRDVEVETWVIPGAPWHARVHKIRTARELDVAEGGFAFPKDQNGQGHADWNTIETDHEIAVLLPWGGTGIKRLLGTARPQIIHTEPNTNVCHPSTFLPTLTEELSPGVHWMASAVFVTPSPHSEQEYNLAPVLEVNGSQLLLKDGFSGSLLLHLDMQTL